MSSIKEYFDQLKAESDILRAAVPEILDHEQDEDKVSEHRIIRGEYISKCVKLLDAIADQEDELASLKRKIRELMREQRLDDSKLERHLFGLIRLRRHGL
jgi:hypothetical protein